MTKNRAERIPDFFVYAMFMASGAAALIYQVIWARWLGFVFGNTTTSISVILASFMLGLALGSFVVSRKLHLIRSPMLVYAYLELAIGIFALCFPIFSLLVDTGYSQFVGSDSSAIWNLSVRTFLAFLILIVPTTFMGATLPLLTDFFRRSRRVGNSWKVGMLYAANTIGAALGTILASFILIELIGIRSTTLVAAGFNMLVALVALRLARSENLPEESFTGRKATATSSPTAMCALLVLALSGGIAMASEILWTRVLEVLVGNSTYAFATILAVYLVGIAIGSWLMSMFVTRIKSLIILLAGTQIGMGLWTISAIVFFTQLAEYFNQLDQSAISTVQVLLFYGLAACLLLPLSILSGAVFPIATKILQPVESNATGELIGKAYAWNTIGALVGSLIAGFVIAATLDYFQSIYLLVLFYGLTSLGVIFVALRENRSIPAYLLGAITITFCMWVIPRSIEDGRFSDRIQKLTNGQVRVAFHEPGLQAITSALKITGEKLSRMLLVNGTGMTLKVTDTKMMSHIPMLLHSKPEQTLVVCFGMGTTYRSAISHGYEVTVVELVQEVVDAFPFFHENAPEILRYEKGNIIINDGRNYLKTTSRSFDVITLDPPPPIDGRGITNLLSVEFFELAKQRLNPGGLMAHWVPLPGSNAGVNDMPTFNMLVDTFRSVFPHVVMIPSLNTVGVHFLGSMEPIELSSDLIEQRLARGSVSNDMNEWEQVDPEFFTNLKELPVFMSRHNLLLTDDRPYLEFNLIRNLSSGTKQQFPSAFW